MSKPLKIPDDELNVSFARSGGPGGQNVNRRETKVTLEFDLSASRILSPADKERALRFLTDRGVISDDAVIRIVEQSNRTQKLNRDAAVKRLKALIADAIRPRKKRLKTKVSKAQKAKRLENKKRHSDKKGDRKKARYD